MIKMSNEKKDLDQFKSSKGDAIRYNQGKLKYELVHPKAHEDMVDVLTAGANKYFARNWENGFSWESVIASLKRHIAAFERGEDYDPETGKLHMAHAACNVHFLNAFYYIFPQGDDRPKNFLKIPRIGLDIDGVLADFTKGWHELYPDVPEKPNSWYLDRKIVERFNKMKEDGSLDDFFLSLPPLVTGDELLFDPVCYITSRPVESEISEIWLDKHNFPRSKVHTVPLRSSKLEIAKDCKIDIFVDDSYENFVELNNGGIFTYLFTAPWNTKYDVGHMRLNFLKDIPLFK